MDDIERALKRFIAVTKAHQYGGLGTDHRLAVKALSAYQENKAAENATTKSVQPRLFT